MDICFRKAAIAAFFIALLISSTSIASASTKTFTNMENAAKYTASEINRGKTKVSFYTYARADREAVNREILLASIMNDKNHDLFFDNGYSKKNRPQYFRGDIISTIYVHSFKPVKGKYIKIKQYQTYEPYHFPAKYRIDVIANRIITRQEQKRYERKIRKLIKKLKLKKLNRYRKIEKATKWITKRVEYGKDLGEDRCHTAYGALVNNLAVCDGKARLLYDLLRRTGVPCRIVRGIGYEDGSKGNHAWNMIKIKGEWYFHDITWIHREDVGSSIWFLCGSKDFTNHISRLSARERRTFHFSKDSYYVDN